MTSIEYPFVIKKLPYLTVALFGSDGRRIFARRKGYRARPRELINNVSMPNRLAEPQGVYHVFGDRVTPTALRVQLGELSIAHSILLAAATWLTGVRRWGCTVQRPTAIRQVV